MPYYTQSNSYFAFLTNFLKSPNLLRRVAKSFAGPKKSFAGITDLHAKETG
jgi:hypothetical protein